MVSLQDVSSNGLWVNGIRVRKTSVLLMDGDSIQIGTKSEHRVVEWVVACTDLHSEFECMHVLKTPSQRMHFFDPTPRAGPLIKTKVRVSSRIFVAY